MRSDVNDLTISIQVIEKFFEVRVAIAPYRPTALQGWVRWWGAPAAALTSLVAVMRAELAPQVPALWALQWALRIPPAAPPIVPAGQPAVLLAKNKILFFVRTKLINTYSVISNCTIYDKYDYFRMKKLLKADF